MNRNYQPMPPVMGAQRPRAIRPWLLILFIIVLLAGAGFVWYFYYGPGKTTQATTTPTTTDPTADWKTYTNKTYGLSFKYPKDWILAEKTFSKNGDSIATLTSPETTTAAKTNKLLKEDMNFRYSEASAKSADVSSNTIGVWLKDKFTNSVTASNATTETINKVEYNEATMEADPSYFAMITSQTNGLFAIDFNVDSKAKLTSTETNILKTIKFTTATTSATTSNLTYTNTDYGFTLTFPAAWKGYKFKKVSLEGTAIPAYYAEIPTTDSNLGKATATQDAGYYSPFVITVYTLAQWDDVVNQGGLSATLITKNDKYAFAWSPANGDRPSDFGNKANDINTIIDSFKLQ